MPFSHSTQATGTCSSTKIKADGSSLLYSTFLGGTSSEAGYGIAVDSAGRAYVAGSQNSSNFPRVDPVIPGIWNGGFLAKLNPSGSELVYSTDLHGTTYAFDVALDAYGNAYITGYNDCYYMPVVNAVQPVCGGYQDAFVAKVTTLPRGDANGDNAVTVADIVHFINYLFAGGTAPVGSVDMNGDGRVSTTDLFALINRFFSGQPV